MNVKKFKDLYGYQQDSIRKLEKEQSKYKKSKFNKLTKEINELVKEVNLLETKILTLKNKRQDYCRHPAEEAVRYYYAETDTLGNWISNARVEESVVCNLCGCKTYERIED